MLRFDITDRKGEIVSRIRKTLAAAGLAAIATFGVGAFATTAAAQPMTPAHAGVAADTNYCGPGKLHVPNKWGKADFNGACQNHDACYSESSTTDRADCDNNFLAGMQAACKSAYGSGADYDACNGIAHTYYEAVHVGGKPFYHGKGNPA